MDDFSRFCGENPDRPLDARRVAGNLSVSARNGRPNHKTTSDCSTARPAEIASTSPVAVGPDGYPSWDFAGGRPISSPS